VSPSASRYTVGQALLRHSQPSVQAVPPTFRAMQVVPEQ
jgi:hypothetical protein